MSQEKPNPQPPQSRSNPELEDNYSEDREPFLGQTINPSPTPSVLEKLQSIWNSALVKIRSLLPENIASKLSDRALTGIVIAIAFLVVGISVNTFSPKSKAIATAPTPEQVSDSQITPKTESVTSVAPPEQQIAQSPLPTEQSESELKNTNLQTPKAPSSLAQEKTSSNSDEKQTIKKQQVTAPLTLEQKLFTIIENQITEAITSLHEDTQIETFSSNPIDAVRVDFASSTLSLKISDDWYSLTHPDQDKLAAEILERSKELDFVHLEITDSKNKLIARNPVVGSKMIILKR
ncbi:hypothetical protein [Mastigocoleus testarum]|uniref:Uncharacterized protein n=1 Tax=Mastigocoleus testarum BC008 TaxID=371196 RepID=A0A0V7ZEX2_9CYAN|nr:hypothetical protein [Mastigocoleus testarum]KST63086.1 hypothetical protein BC008_12315 [Mastigocoleus testarum BC008]KST69056.1 hypothetical protein BC008_34585 [Mastigocoleus testarum BC008]